MISSIRNFSNLLTVWTMRSRSVAKGVTILVTDSPRFESHEGAEDDKK